MVPALGWAACATDQDALAWLERMSRSLREVSYQGIFTYQHGATMQALKISHSVYGNGATEQVTQLSGRGGTVQRTEHPLDCIHPGSKLVRISSGFHDSGCGLAENYSLKLGSNARIAGRKAQLLRVIPKDMYRYGYRMALDSETGLLLRSQTLAQDGKVLEHFQFADLKIGTVEASGTQVEVLHEAGHGQMGRAASAARPSAARHGRTSSSWEANWVPEGFMSTTEGDVVSAEKTYTDGLAVFSVFMEQLENDIQPGEGRARQGGTTAYTRGIRLGGQPVLITVIGEVPVNTARMVANSVNWLVAADAH